MNKLLPWDLAIYLNSLRCILDFKFWDAPSLTFLTHLGDTKSLVFIWAWSSIFISETVVTQISQLFMLQAPHTWFIVAQVRSFGEWLSIIARSELGSDLDCSVINARSELGSDLDCYELKHWNVVFFQFEIINVLVSSFAFIWIPMLWVYSHNKYFNSFKAGTDI